MLYNPKWEKPEVMSMEGLIQWLETQDPTKTYHYTDRHECLLAQYVKAKGYRKVKVSSDSFTHGWFNRRVEIPWAMNMIAAFNYTFGGALREARKHV